MLKLIRRIWDKFLTLDDSEMMEVMREPSQVTIIAAEVGNFEFLSVIMSTYPNLLWELSNKGQRIIHIAVFNRHASIFNLIHEIRSLKDCINSFLNDGENNLLHSAAMLAPPDRLNIVSGEALQMMLELSWFEVCIVYIYFLSHIKKYKSYDRFHEVIILHTKYYICDMSLIWQEVKKNMQPHMVEMKNSEGMTPRELFTKEHAELLTKGESWMKQTANSCMVVSTLIATGVFSAAFSLPGGNNDNTESPNYLDKPAFLVFALSDSMALISSSTSILIFLSILISRYAEQDFLKSLPLKLISGLVALFVSIISMMIAFSSAFFITYYHGLKWVPNFISVLAFLPIPLFICLQFSLWSDIVYFAYICSSLFRPSKRMIH